MLFNSIEYLFFLPVAFLLYWFVFNRKLSYQNLLLLVLSYFFYACWDWRFLFLLMFSTFLDYYTGIKMAEAASRDRKKFWFWLSIIINLGFLAVFKYFNFFAASFGDMLSGFGYHADPWMLDVILPVGISFYTFHGLSYVIDIYKDRIKPEYNFVEYSVFVSFFPLLVAGPIERATHLLPQIKVRRVFDYAYASEGMRQILWGLFKKVVVADNCSAVVNLIFANYETQDPATLVIGAVFFAFQIYGDFSGYSDIAIGTAKLFGIDLMRNFAFPYFSRDIPEFWRRWHISLSTWFRDYLYFPLGGSKGGMWMVLRNTFIIFIVSGFWHGANWTFIVWGALNALYMVPFIISKKNRLHIDGIAKEKWLPSLKEFVQILITFALTCIAWIFFRSVDVKSAVGYIANIFSLHGWSVPQIDLKPFAFIGLMLVVEWFNRHKQQGLSIGNLPTFVRWISYILLILIIIFFGANSDSFIYFQF
ncbi:MAG TPA: MBOAT family O-acyltransferase [Flavobacterium sp.]|jgi:D-alanyl-lipoteichoic acid acyltransferase DltB (MBOAT superfamily)